MTMAFTPERGEAREIPIPTRADGTPKRFWYDPVHPGHIMHYIPEESVIRGICVGHAH